MKFRFRPLLGLASNLSNFIDQGLAKPAGALRARRDLRRALRRRRLLDRQLHARGNQRQHFFRRGELGGTAGLSPPRMQTRKRSSPKGHWMRLRATCSGPL